MKFVQLGTQILLLVLISGKNTLGSDYGDFLVLGVHSIFLASIVLMDIVYSEIVCHFFTTSLCFCIL